MKKFTLVIITIIMLLSLNKHGFIRYRAETLKGSCSISITEPIIDEHTELKSVPQACYNCHENVIMMTLEARYGE